MRFIHTADWHLGNQFHDINRTKEAEAFFTWLRTQIIEKQAEALIVAGDIFDTVNPSTEARRLYYSFLASLCSTSCKNIIITGGNHDSAVMLDAAKELLEVLNIRVVGSINNLKAEDMVIEIKDYEPTDTAKKETSSQDNTVALCLAVPFVRELELRNLITATSEESSEKNEIADADLYSRAYEKLYSSVAAEAEKIRANRPLPIITTGHLYAANLEGRLAGAASNQKTDDGVKVLDTIGTLGNVPSSVFPKNAHYVALGHIHYTTMVDKNPKIRYSGSPFVMGFDEALMPHYVLCVDVQFEKEPKVEKLEVPQTFIYRRLSGSLEEIQNQLKETAKIQSEKPVFLEICYKRQIGTNAQEYLEDDIKALPENTQVVSWKIMTDENHYDYADSGFENLDSAEIKNLDSEQVFRQLILSKTGLASDSPEAKSVLEKFLPLFIAESDS